MPKIPLGDVRRRSTERQSWSCSADERLAKP
jgi:hypothetical protein